MLKRIENIVHNRELLRYLIVGTTTTLLDLAVYYYFCEINQLDPSLSNVISLAVSVIYAYFANKLIVFRTHCSSAWELIKEFGRFMSGRAGTLALEMGMVFLLSNIVGIDGFISKLLTQVIIFISNYLISKFWAFRKKDQNEK